MRPSVPLLAGSFVAALVTSVYILATAVTIAVGLPWDLPLPLVGRALGAVPFAYGVYLIARVFRSRGWRAVVESSYVTFVKLLRGTAVEERLGRQEPLVVSGIYGFVRHPLYAGVGAIALGMAFLVARTAAFLGAALLISWFVLVVVPFEERELRALFGEAYAAYARRTPRYLPRPRRSKPP